MLVQAIDITGRVVVGTLGPFGVLDEWVRLTEVTHSIDPRKPWEQSDTTEPEVLVRAETVESLD